MATLVLSTVGNALGGPVGSAIGALIGQSIDQQLLGPKSRGPRLGDLKVQSSSYGIQVPRIYGAMRVAGTVVWATDLVESSQVSGAKGQPDTTYSYSVSLAIALSSRRVRGIGRIWADGKLLRGAAGDFKVSTGFRFYDGDEDQQLDPLIASHEGLASSPAYRGLAMAVFEDLQLAEFGNRIPFMTFEVFADEGPVAVGDILSDASSGLIGAAATPQVTGFAAYGQSIKAAVETLIDCCAVELTDGGSRLVAVSDGAALLIDDDHLGNSSDGRPAARIQREQTPAQALPCALRLGYYDPALDYQSGEARASAAGRLGTEEQRELPAAISASEAKSIAQRMIAREWAQRDKLTLRLPPSYLGLQPGSRLEMNLSPRIWRVERCTVDAFVVVAELRPCWSPGAAIAADGGRMIASPDFAAKDVTVALFDVPDVLAQGSDSPTVLLAASRPTPGWKGYTAEVTAGEQRLQVRTATRKTVLGRALTALASSDAYLIDEAHSVDVELIDPEQWLVSCEDKALVGGRNLAVLGSEVLQFGSVEPLGQGRFRLSRLLRGRAGTEWATGSHAIGDAFAVIEADTLRAVPLPSWSIGTSVGASLANLSGSISAADPRTLSGENLRPLSPVAVQASADLEGNLSIAWTRRSRRGFAWIDEMDAPLGESSEQYRVTITGADGSIEIQTSEPAVSVAAAQLAALGEGAVIIEVRQIGEYSVSRPGLATITL